MVLRIGIDVHTIGSFATGNEIYIYQLTRALMLLDKRNDYVLYVTNPDALTNRTDCPPNFNYRLLRPHMPFIRIPFSLPVDILRHPVDVLHVQYIGPPVCPCNLVVAIHDLASLHLPAYYPWRERLLNRFLIPLTARKAARILTISEYSKNDIVSTLRVPSDKVIVTYLGVDPETFHPISKRQQIDNVLHCYGIGTPYILYVGNVEPRKNLHRLIEAFALLRRKGSINHRLVIVGQRARLSSKVLDAIGRVGLTEGVIFTGYVSIEHLPMLYSAADVFVYPSIFEGFGLPPLEAMACGTPVIVSSTSSLPEVVGDAGLKVNPIDVSAIADAIYKVVLDSDLRQEMSEKGLQQAQRFSWEETARGTLAVYEEVASQR